MTLSVDADISAEEDLFGLTVSDLQQNIEISSSNAITGTLKYVDSGWDSGTWGSGEDTGNYLALHFESNFDDATITVELVGGDHGPVDLDDDGLIILRIKNTSQTIKVTTSKEGYAGTTTTYTLTGLTLQGE